jgi:hypothetical protein
MARNKLIYDTRDLETASQEVLEKVDKALVAAAFKIRDEMRNEFIKSQSNYKYNTSEYKKMASGIMVGRLNNSQIKIHALGNKSDDGTWKARFFVGGTIYRKNNKGNKGYIKPNEAVDNGLINAESILNTFIKNSIDK